MIGDQSTGTIQNTMIEATAHSGLRVTYNGHPAKLAIVDEDGKVIVSGPAVAREAEAVAVNSYRNFLKGQGHLRVLSQPLPPPARAAA